MADHSNKAHTIDLPCPKRIVGLQEAEDSCQFESFQQKPDGTATALPGFQTSKMADKEASAHTALVADGAVDKSRHGHRRISNISRVNFSRLESDSDTTFNSRSPDDEGGAHQDPNSSLMIGSEPLQTEHDTLKSPTTRSSATDSTQGQGNDNYDVTEENHPQCRFESVGKASKSSESCAKRTEETTKEEDGACLDKIPKLPDEEDISRLRKLLDVFDTIGIQRNVGIYTRLTEEEKRFLSPIFQDILGNVFCPTFELGSKLHKDHDQPPVVYCKNLFLKDRKGQFYLVITDDSYKADLKKLKQQMNAARNLSFATVDDLANILQVKPGEVTPFAIMQESAKDVRVVLHESLLRVMDESHNNSNAKMAFHPFSPLFQTEILFLELDRFLKHQGKELEVLGRENPDISKPTASQILNHEYLDATNDTQGNSDKQAVPEKRGNRIPKKLPHWDRKGKLKSFIKKNNTNTNNKNTNGEDFNSGEQNGNSSKSMTEDANGSERESKTNNCLPPLRHDEQGDTRDLVDTWKTNSNSEDHERIEKEATDVNRIQIYSYSDKTTPEIDAFYNSLRSLQISYREFSVASTTSNEIGPALGVRCFLMKDRRHNYYVIVSHEFYELDYGRLKKALHPKKKLDECDVDDLPLVLGVDRQHFTPFAVMNVNSARRATTATSNNNNNVHVFFTQKIVPDNVILCVQHPFGPGRRILIPSSELQRLLGPYSCAGVVGVVEEKPWPKKYNVAFSQFDRLLVNTDTNTDRDENTTDDLSLSTSLLRVSHNKTQTLESNKDFVKQDNITITPEQKDNNGNFEPNNWVSMSTYFANGFSRLLNLFSNTSTLNTNNSYQSVQPSDTSKTNNSMYCDTRHANSSFENEGSSVDPEFLTEREQDKAASPKQIIKRMSNVHSFGSEKRDKFPSVTNNDVQQKPPRNQPDARFQTEPQHDSKSPIGKSAAVSVGDVTHHLDRHDVSYLVKDNNDYARDDDYNGNGVGDDGDDDDDDDDTVSQVCHTMHLSDASGQENYIIVGRYSEQISIKRFRRRFQIANRLVIVNGVEGERDYTDAVRTVTLTNPFSAFMSLMGIDSDRGLTYRDRDLSIFLDLHDDVTNTTHGDPAEMKQKHLLVLFSSIYMDPDMTCVFPVGDPEGTCLCVTSGELENYARRVGMEVWYMN